MQIEVVSDRQLRTTKDSNALLTALAAIALPAFAYYLLYASRLGEGLRYGIDESLISLNLSEVPFYLVPAIWFLVAITIFLIWSPSFFRAIGVRFGLVGWATFFVGVVAGLAIASEVLDPFLRLVSWFALLALGPNASACSVLILVALIASTSCAFVFLLSLSISFRRAVLCRIDLPFIRQAKRHLFIAFQVILITLASTCLIVSLAALYTAFDGGTLVWISMLVVILFVAVAVGRVCKEDVRNLIPHLSSTLVASPMKALLAVTVAIVVSGFVMIFIEDNDFFSQMPENRLLFVESKTTPVGSPRAVQETWCVLTTFDGDRAVVRRAELSPAKFANNDDQDLYTVGLSGEYRVVSLQDEAFDFFSAKVNFVEKND